MKYIFILVLAYLGTVLSGMQKWLQGNGHYKAFNEAYKISLQYPTAKKFTYMYELKLLDAEDEITSHERLSEKYDRYLRGKR